MKEDIAQKYLEGLLKFKAKKDLHAEFVPLKARKQLLKELAIDLGFTEEIWKSSRKIAKSHFLAFNLLNDDDQLKSKVPKKFKQKIESELLGAINLDPYNEHYLKTYVLSHYGNWKPSIELKKRYLNLFNPASSEYTEALVELGLSMNETHSEFLDDQVTGPFINALVFLRDQQEHVVSSLSKQEIKQLKDQSGLSKAEMKELSGDLKSMLDTLNDTINNHWLSFKDMHKGLLVVDRLVALAPSNPNVLHAAIYFYGHSLWRLCLGSLAIKSTAKDLQAFYNAYLGKEKPSKKERLAAAKMAFEKATILEQQFMRLPKQLFKKDDNDDWRPQFSPSSFKIRQIMQGQDLDHNFIKTFMSIEEWNFESEIKLFEFKQKNLIFGIILGLILLSLTAYVSYYYLQNLWLLINFGVIPILAATWIMHLRELWWKRRLKDGEE